MEYGCNVFTMKKLGIDRMAMKRERCAFLHINGMDEYFDEEGKELLDVF